MDQDLHVLIVEDSEEDYELILHELKHTRYQVKSTRVETQHGLVQNLNRAIWDMIICDNTLPHFSGDAALHITRKMDQDTPFIIVSGTIGEEAAVRAMRSGANDYILKDNLKRLAPVVEREIREAKFRLKQKQNEKRIVLTELRYQFLAESIKDVFFALDFDLNITYWNEAASKEFKKRKVLGRHLLDVFPEWKNLNITSSIEKALLRKAPETITLEYQAKNIESFKGNVYPSTEGVSILLSKVTEEKLNEDKLISINKELETLLYRISHDLRGPVASVIGLLNIVRKDDTFEKEVFIDMMDSGMSRLNHTLKELLNISNIKLGQPNIQKFEVNQLIESVINSHQFTPGFDELTFEVRVDDSLTLYSDVSLVQSIWQNLVENAIKYRKKGSPNTVRITGHKHNEVAELDITDTGQGIPINIQSQVFEMFFRGNEESNGSGLGLYIVKSAMHKINGNITLDSAYTRGTRFSLAIPDLTYESILVKN